ncbi:MAG: potassium channel family protein [Halioglobus sp.]
MQKVTTQNNFIYLTGSLICLLVFSALIDSIPGGFAHLFLQCIVFSTFVIAYRSLNFGVIWRRFVGSLVVLLLISSALHEFLAWQYAGIMDLILMLLFFVAAAYRCSLQVLFSGKIDRNIIVGSMAIYLLLGLLWSILYLLALELSPGAFNGMVKQNWAENFPISTYFSYVTLTSLGYGDISPAGPVTRVLVYLEAISGTFYMAVVVASLVSASKSGHKH